MLKIVLRAAIVSILFAFALSAFAEGEINLVVERDKILVGRDEAAIILSSAVDLKNAELILNRSDGKKIRLNSGPLPGGGEYRFSWSHPAGSFHYIAKLYVYTPDGQKGEVSATFAIEGISSMKIRVPPDKRDLKDRTLHFYADRVIKKAELEVFGEGGKRLAYESVDYPSPSPGTLCSVKWEQDESEILRMVLKVYDKDNFWNMVEFFPWRIDIPHDEVNFEFGKWDILKTEEPKLVKALQHVQKALQKYGKYGNPKLYVAGYTDTVGSLESNLALSTNRARAIAFWFQKSGLNIPIYYQGFGEAVLAKDTPDETEELLNRRALYVIAAEKPHSPDFPGNRSWNKVK
ncbi:MAG: hypothetical protein Kow0090_09990 [Myxococcota bacterium]